MIYPDLGIGWALLSAFVKLSDYTVTSKDQTALPYQRNNTS